MPAPARGRSKVELPVPSIEGLPPAAAKLLTKAMRPQKTVEQLGRTVRSLGGAIGKAHHGALLACIEQLARTLARLEPLHHISSKPLRLTAYERQKQLEILAAAARVASKRHDEVLVALAADLPDGVIRGVLVEVVHGNEAALPSGAQKEIAALLDDRTASDAVLLRCAMQALFATSPSAARARWRRILHAAPRAKSARDLALVSQVFDEIERNEKDPRPWGADVFPLATHTNTTIGVGAGTLISRRKELFVTYLAWALEHDDSARVADVISKQLYWARLRGLAAPDVARPLAELHARAVGRKDRRSADALSRAMTSIGLAPKPVAPDRGEILAHVGTEGGPPLVVPAAYVSAWLGVVGPEPFDSGNSDYERACDARRAPVIAIGKGHGVVLDAQGCDVYAEPRGLMFHSDGDLAQEVARAWKKVGSIAVPAGGVVVLDAAEVGKEKGVNRKKVALAAGTYDVMKHAPQGAGGDLSAIRLVLRPAR